MKTDKRDIDGPDGAGIQKMFNEIAGSYDLLNRILSFGIDNRWRRKGLSMFNRRAPLRLLDLGCGTGDLSRLSFRFGFTSVVGADFSMEMLLKGKPGNRDFSGISLCAADAGRLPFKDSSFTSCCIAFAVRNFQDRGGALREISRVLDDSGELMIIEFSMPGSRLIRFMYNIYFFHILPVIGWAVSGNYRAYKYLPQSVGKFPSVEDFSELILGSGFSRVRAARLTLGIAHIYLAVK